MRTFLRHWQRSAAEFCVLLVVVQLPIALLFSAESRLYYQTPWELAKDVALLVLVYGAIAAIMAVVVAAVASGLRLSGELRARQFMAVTVLIFCGIVLLGLQPMVQKWWWQTLDLLKDRGITIRFNAAPYFLLLLIAVIGSYLWRRGFVAGAERVSTSLRNGVPLTLGILAISASVAAATGHLHWRPFGWSKAAAEVAPAAPGVPNVFLVTIDTLSARDMSLYGYQLPTTPGLERFARNAHVFEHFLANSNFTTPTVTSMLTGRYPVSHTVYQRFAGVRPEHRAFNLATVLKRHGYTTAAVVSNPLAHPMNINIGEDFDYVTATPDASPGHTCFRLLGFTHAGLVGFFWDWWLGPAVREIVTRIPLSVVQRSPWYPPGLVIEEARKFLAENRHPAFLWTHFYAPHDPYLSPAPYLGKFLQGGDVDSLYEQMVESPAHTYNPAHQQAIVDKLRLRYDENIAYVDHEVGEFLDSLERAGALRNALVIIAADHGESFDRGWRGHLGPMLYQPLVHIPLIIRLPDQQAPGSRITANAEQVDLLPTVLDVLNIPKPQWSDGESLLPVLRGGAPSAKTKYSMTVEKSVRFKPLTNGTVAVIRDKHKLIRYMTSGCEELFDLEADPAELVNLASKDSETAAALRIEIPRLIGVPLPETTGKRADCSRPWADQI